MTQNYIERYWRDATPADAIKEPPMVARFRDEDDKEWLIGKLFGVDRSRKYKWCGETRDAIKCQVYDAPDPGEGWRLVDVDSETPQHGDEWLDDNGAWKKRSCGGVSSFCNLNIYRRRITPDPGEGWRLIDISTESHEVEKEFWHVGQHRWIGVSTSERFFGDLVYRRRITPAVTYVPFTWDDREQLRGRWITWKHENGLMIESQIDHINQHRDGGLWFKSHDATWLLENATFLDTGKPVGKEVVQ